MSFRVGVVTIGQSPREDIVSEIRQLLPHAVDFIQTGTLDGITRNEVQSFLPQSTDHALVTILQGGHEVSVAKKHILPLVKRRISELAKKDVHIITLLCSGELSDCRGKKPILVPSKLIEGVLRALHFRGSLGVLVPSEKQINASQSRYESMGFRTLAKAVSPYTQGHVVKQVAGEMAGVVDVLLMDCFGTV